MAENRVLTLKYRPTRLDELWVQEHVRTTLASAIQNGRLANAYLFAGPRGVGKTTTARILAKSLNCEHGPTVTPCNECSFCREIASSRSLDVIEIDGASNRGIDAIRDLRDSIRYAPNAARFKIYIIDEIHMLTEPAFNALLKTLEEPPAHAKFVFATTHAHAVPPTIISRCQRFDFRKATPGEIRDRLAWLAEKEHIAITDGALLTIARRADGALRDAESMLDQLAAFRPEGIDVPDVEELLGIVPGQFYSTFASLVVKADAAGMLELIARIFENGRDPIEFLRGAVEYFRQLLTVATGSSVGLSDLTPEEAAAIKEMTKHFTPPRILAILDRLTTLEDTARNSEIPRALLEVAALELTMLEPAPRPSAPSPSPHQPDCTNEKEVSEPSIWNRLRLETNKHKPLLAAALDLASESKLSEDTLTLTLPADQRGVLANIEAERTFIEQQLLSIAGRRIRLALKLASPSSGVDPVSARLTRIFGRIEEH